MHHRIWPRGALITLLTMLLGACTAASPPHTAAPSTSTEASTTSPEPGRTVAARNLPTVEHFVSLAQAGLRRSFVAVYLDTYLAGSRAHRDLFAVAHRGGQWRTEDSDSATFDLNRRLYSCRGQSPAFAWTCTADTGSGMGGEFFLTVDSYPPRALEYQLEKDLSDAPANAVRMSSRRIDDRPTICLTISNSAADPGATWCVLGTGVFADFSTQGTTSQTGAKSLVLEDLTDTVAPDTFTLPAVPKKASG